MEWGVGWAIQGWDNAGVGQCRGGTMQGGDNRVGLGSGGRSGRDEYRCAGEFSSWCILPGQWLLWQSLLLAGGASLIIVGTIGVTKVAVISFFCTVLKVQVTESLSGLLEVALALLHNDCRLPNREFEPLRRAEVRGLQRIVVGWLSGRGCGCTGGAISHLCTRGGRGCAQCRDLVLISARLRAHMIPSDSRRLIGVAETHNRVAKRDFCVADEADEPPPS